MYILTYGNAKRVKIGDTLNSKDGYRFTVSKITEESNAANTEQYVVFSGISTRGIDVFYNHKQIK